MQTWTYNTQEPETHAPGAKGLGNDEEGKFILTAWEGTRRSRKVKKAYLDVSDLSLVGQVDR